jgi:hypothetical protein
MMLLPRPVRFADLVDLDPVGLPTVGYGHLCANAQCTDVPYPIPLSLANGERLLRDDLRVREETPVSQVGCG